MSCRPRGRLLLGAGVVCAALAADAHSGAGAGESLSARERAALLELELAEAHRAQRSLGGVSTEGAAVTAFRRWAPDGPMLKVQIDVYGEVGRRSQAYYYDAGRPLYMVGAEWTYGMPIGAEGGGSDAVVTSAGGFGLADGPWDGWSFGDAQAPADDARSMALSLLRLMGAPGPSGLDACEWICAEGALPACTRFACAE